MKQSKSVSQLHSQIMQHMVAAKGSGQSRAQTPNRTSTHLKNSPLNQLSPQPGYSNLVLGSTRAQTAQKERPKSALTVGGAAYGSFTLAKGRDEAKQAAGKTPKQRKAAIAKGKDPSTDHIKTLLLMQQQIEKQQKLLEEQLVNGRIAQAAIFKTIAKVNGSRLDDTRSERPRSEAKAATKASN
jgi:hypothetical protein